MTAAGKDKVLLGVVLGPQGLKGRLRIKSFTEVAAAIAAYGPLSDEQGRRLQLTVIGEAKGALLCDIEGVRDRSAAEALKGTKLYVARKALPAPEDDSFYHADLIGLDVVGPQGDGLGKVVAVENFGAGDLLEIEGPDGQRRFYPFTRQSVPEVDLAAGRLVLIAPGEVEVPEEGEIEA